MPDYTPYNIQTNFKPQHQGAENANVQQLQMLQQLASVPGLQEHLAKMMGFSAGASSMRQGGRDGAWSAAIAHESTLNPDRNSAYQQMAPQSDQLVNTYNNVGNPASRADDQRRRLVDAIYLMFGDTNLPKHPGIEPRASY